MNVVAMLLAAAVSTAAPAPLIVPPQGMHHLARDPGLAKQMVRIEGLKFLDEYRVTVHPTVGNVTMSRSIVLSTGIIPNRFGASASDYGNMVLQHASHSRNVKVAGARAVMLCDGRTGWLNNFSFPKDDTQFEQVFVNGAAGIYVATLTRPLSVTDPYHSDRALLTLCPPPAQVAKDTETLPFAPPHGWTRANASAMSAPAPLVAKGLWVSMRSGQWEAISLAQAPAGLGDETLDDRMGTVVDEMQVNAADFKLVSSSAAKRCGGAQDGWLVQYTIGDAKGHKQFVESMYAFGEDKLYILNYSRAFGTPENPQARAALNGLCATASHETN